MSSLSPVSNLFAIHDPDVLALKRMAGEFLASGDFVEAFICGGKWLVGVDRLPGSTSASPGMKLQNLFFAEGEDRIIPTRGEESFWKDFAEVVDDSTSALSKFPGDFCFIRVDSSGTLTAVSSCAGVAPLYHWRGGQRMAVGTRLGDFVRYSGAELRPDRFVNFLWSAGEAAVPENRTLLEEVRCLPKGGYGKFIPAGRVSFGSYWQPDRHALRLSSFEERSEKLRELLLSFLKRNVPEEGSLLTLSGGLDSSLLAVLGQGVLGKKFSAWSYLANETALQEHMKPARQSMEALKQMVQFQNHFLQENNTAARMKLLRQAPRVVCQVMHPALGALPELQRQIPIQVLWGGEFADHLLGGPILLTDWFAAISFPRLIRSLPALPYGPKNVFGWVRRRWKRWMEDPELPIRRTIPGYYQADLQEEFLEWRRQLQKIYLQRLKVHAHPLGEHFLTNAGFASMNWEGTTAVQVRRIFPFYNREIVEFAFGVPPEDLFGPGTKKILRSSFQKDLPAVVYARNDKGKPPPVRWKPPEVTPPEDLHPDVERWMNPKSLRPEKINPFCACSSLQISLFLDAVYRRRTGKLNAHGACPGSG